MDEIGVDAARWYLISRGPDQTIEIDVDLAKEKSSKNPVYYVQYVHARIAGIFRNAGEAPVGGSPPSRARRRREEPDPAPARAARRSLPRRPSGAARMRSRTYAIRVADDFHRFYTEHRVLESDAQAFRLGPLPRDADGRRALPRSDRGRSSGTNVTTIRP